MSSTSRPFGSFLVLFTVVALLLGFAASRAFAGTADEVGLLPTVDPLNRSESPLSNGGKWTTLNWATNSGQDTASGWGPASAFPTVTGAYWNPAAVDGRYGDAAALTMQTAPGISERYVSVWVNMPSPGSAKSGYQLRWTVNPETSKYTVKLSKWVAGTETVLASNPEVSIPLGTTLAIADTGGTVSAWRSENGTTFTSLLSASDATYEGGYAGLEGAGNISRSINFKAGPLLGAAAIASPVLDNLERQEVPLATGKWTKTNWAAAIGGAWMGSYRGYGSSGGLAGAYWNGNAFADSTGGSLVAATVGTGAAPSGQYLGLWLAMPEPGSARSGYEARFTGTNGTATAYKVELSKWVAGTRTVLATKEGFSLAVGTTLALTDSGSGIVLWTGSGGTLTPLLNATDTTYASGYAGLEVNGGAGTVYNFRAASLGGAPETTITAGPTGSVLPQNVSFTFSSTPAGASFECALDAGAYASCTSPKAYPTIEAGPHTFRVRAVSSAGTDPTPAERSFTVVKPPTATSKDATAVKDKSATLNADLNPNGAATTYQFEWGTGASYGNLAPASAKAAGSGSSVVEASEPLTGLSPDTEYHFRISATNANGTTKGADKVFTTTNKPVAITAEPGDVSAEEATLRATVNPHGAATTYYFEYGPTSAYGSKAPASAASAGAGRAAVEVGEPITGLTEGSTYHYRVVAENEIGTSTGADQTFTTPLMPEAVTEGSEAVEANDAILTGTIDPNGEETTYQFEYGPTQSYGSSVALGGIEAGSSADPVEVMGAPTYLQPETTYHYRIVAESQAGRDVGGDQTLTTGARVMTPQEEAARAAQDDAYTSGPATLPDDFVGLMWSGRWEIESDPAEMEVIYNSGAKVLRWPVNVDWLITEDEWKRTDTVFKEAAERGIRILPNLDGGQDLILEGRAPEWRAFVDKAVKRWGPGGSVWDQVTNDLPPIWWEVGNENNYYIWNPEPRVNPELFGKYIRISSEALDDASSFDLKVVLGGLIAANFKLVENPSPGVEVVKQLPVGEFIESMNEGRNHFDALGLHPYVFYSGGHEPRNIPQVKDVREKVRAFIAEARNALDRIGAPNKQIWLTELGWPVEAPTDAGHPHVTEPIQRDLITYTFSMIMNRASQYKIRNVLYYNHRDHPDGNTPGSDWYQWAYQCGLRKNNGEVRLAWYAYRKQAFKDDNYPRNPGAKTKGRNAKAKKSTVFAEVNPEGMSTTYYFQWGPTADLSKINRTGDKPAGYKQGYVGVSEEISGLTPEREYRYRVVAVNANNMVEPGQWEQFTTPPSSSTSSKVERVLHGLNGYVWVEGWVKEGFITGPGPGLANVHVHVKIFRNGSFEKFVDVMTDSQGHYESGYIPVGKGALETRSDFPGGLEWDPSQSDAEPFTVRDGVLIKAKHSNNCLDVEGGRFADGVKVMHGGCHGEANQVFSLRPKGNGQYLEIIARHSGKCLDVGWASQNDGEQIVQHTCNGATNQAFGEAWWGETPYTSYVAQHSNKCLDVANAAIGWAALQQWSCNSGEQQRFSLTPVESGPIPTETTMEVDQVLHGSPGMVSASGWLKAGPYGMGGRVVQLEFDNASVGGWSTLFSQPITVSANGSFEYRDYGVSPGHYNVRARFVGGSDFKTSQSGEKFRTVKRGYQFVNRYSNQCLTLSENKNQNGAAIIQWPCVGAVNGNGQVLSFWPQGNGWYEIRVNGTNRCVDVAGANPNNDAVLQLYDCLGAGQYNQHWDREPIAGQAPWYALIARHSNRCASNFHWSTTAGSRIIQWDCVWASNQQWELRGVIDP